MNERKNKRTETVKKNEGRMRNVEKWIGKRSSQHLQYSTSPHAHFDIFVHFYIRLIFTLHFLVLIFFFFFGSCVIVTTASIFFLRFVFMDISVTISLVLYNTFHVQSIVPPYRRRCHHYYNVKCTCIFCVCALKYVLTVKLEWEISSKWIKSVRVYFDIRGGKEAGGRGEQHIMRIELSICGKLFPIWKCFISNTSFCASKLLTPWYERPARFLFIRLHSHR